MSLIIPYWPTHEKDTRNDAYDDFVESTARALQGPEHQMLWRRWSLGIASSMLLFFEGRYPENPRVRMMVDVAGLYLDGKVGQDHLEMARKAPLGSLHSFVTSLYSAMVHPLAASCAIYMSYETLWALLPKSRPAQREVNRGLLQVLLTAKSLDEAGL